MKLNATLWNLWKKHSNKGSKRWAKNTYIHYSVYLYGCFKGLVLSLEVAWDAIFGIGIPTYRSLKLMEL